MNELRAKLRVKAEAKLGEMIKEVGLAAVSATKGTPVGWEDLLRVSEGTRTASLTSTLVGILVRGQERRLLEGLDDKPEPPVLTEVVGKA